MLEKHIPLVRALMEEFTRRQMLDLVELEQCLATGVDN